jgi:hypothetical protein
VLPVTVQVPGEGTYSIEGTVTSPGATASQNAELTAVVTVMEEEPPSLTIYLPLIRRD